MSQNPNHLPYFKIKPSLVEKTIANFLLRRFKKYLKNEIPEFLRQSPYAKGLPIGSPLSYAFAGIFLLDLDLELKNPLLRQSDDYLIFCRGNFIKIRSILLALNSIQGISESLKKKLKNSNKELKHLLI